MAGRRIDLARDFRDPLSAFVAREVRFLVVGAYALAAMGRPRATADLGVWVDPTPDNAERTLDAGEILQPAAGSFVGDEVFAADDGRRDVAERDRLPAGPCASAHRPPRPQRLRASAVRIGRRAQSPEKRSMRSSHSAAGRSAKTALLSAGPMNQSPRATSASSWPGPQPA